jgi:hypothetical protein
MMTRKGFTEEVFVQEFTSNYHAFAKVFTPVTRPPALAP